MTPTSATDRLPSASGRQVARHRIRERLQEMILSGNYRPGARLVQQDLARRFDVGQGLVREALLELQSNGLVETVDRRGVFVKQIDARMLLESFHVREMHEGLIARLCCGRLNDADHAELTKLAQAMPTLAEEGRLDEMAQLDRKFHHRLLHLADNQILVRLADNYRLLGKVVRANRDPAVVCDEHMAVLDAVADDAPDKAERLMRRHISAAREAVEQMIRKRELPDWVA
ncbi:MAG: GntR family transcriptional regulator [Phycisphaeraceae bacterium]